METDIVPIKKYIIECRKDNHYNDDNLMDDTFKLIFRQPIRRL